VILLNSDALLLLLTLLAGYALGVFHQAIFLGMLLLLDLCDNCSICFNKSFTYTVPTSSFVSTHIFIGNNRTHDKWCMITFLWEDVEVVMNMCERRKKKKTYRKEREEAYLASVQHFCLMNNKVHHEFVLIFYYYHLWWSVHRSAVCFCFMFYFERGKNIVNTDHKNMVCVRTTKCT
jgi:hypothetical protein